MTVPESKKDPKYKTLTDNILAGLKMMVEMGTAPSTGCRCDFKGNS